MTQRPRRDRSLAVVPRDPAPPGAGSLLFVLAALAALAPQTARAEPLAATLEVAGGLSRLDYAELGPTGAFVDGEEGWVPDLSAAAEVGTARWFFAGRAGARWGDVAYDGRVQSSNAALNGLPARTTTEAVFLRADMGGGVRLGERRRVALEAGVGWRSWERDIRPGTVVSRTGSLVPVSGLYEEYTWYEVRGGVRWTFLATPRTEWDLELALLHTLAPRLALEWLGQPVALDLGPRAGWRAGLAFRLALPRDAFVALRVGAEGFEHGASERDPRTGLHEPEGETRNVWTQAGVGVRL